MVGEGGREWGGERFRVSHSNHLKNLFYVKLILRIAVPYFRYFQKLRGEGNSNLVKFIAHFFLILCKCSRSEVVNRLLRSNLALQSCFALLTSHLKKKKIVISCQCLRKRNFTIKLGLENPFLKTKNVAILSSCFPMEIISGGEERQPLLDRPLLFHLP